MDKQPQLQWLTMDEAIEHCAQAPAIWDGPALPTARRSPTLCSACAGDIDPGNGGGGADPREQLPHSLRVVNVVDLMALTRPRTIRTA